MVKINNKEYIASEWILDVKKVPADAVMTIEKETEKAYLLIYDDGKKENKIWFPKSQLKEKK